MREAPLVVRRAERAHPVDDEAVVRNRRLEAVLAVPCTTTSTPGPEQIQYRSHVMLQSPTVPTHTVSEHQTPTQTPTTPTLTCAARSACPDSR